MFTVRRSRFSCSDATVLCSPSSLLFEVGSSSKGSNAITSWSLGATLQQQQQPVARPARQHSCKHGIHAVQAFASLSGSRLFGIHHTEGNIRHTFNKIDVDRKGHITASDLAAYAESHSLPSTYVTPFLDAVRRHQQQQQQRQQQQQQLTPGSSEFDELEEEGEEVGFDAFRTFVRSREAGLRQAFDAFDVDGDGHISPSDLCCSVARVAICCPTGCVLRPRREVVAELMQRLNREHGPGRLSFPEFRDFFLLLPDEGQLVEYWLSGPAAVSCADMGGHFSMQDTRSKQRRGAPWGHLLAGAVAGAASRSATAPLETLRLAAMAGLVPRGTSLLSAGRQLVAGGGVGALYKGNLVNVLRSAPARAVDFFAFDLFKSWLGSDTYSKTFAAAGLAGTFSWMLLYPLEVVRSRLTLDSSRYSGIKHCISTMMAAEGPAAFYQGLGPSVAAIAPEAAITYGLHDLLKRGYRNMYHTEPGVAASLVCGVAAAWSGQLVAFPLETVSRRMQLAGAAAAAAAAAAAGGGGAAAAAAAPPPLQAAAAAVAGGTAVSAAAAPAGGGGGAAGAGVVSVLCSIVREGGPGALYRGLGAATLRLVPSAIISFGMYEVVQKVWLDVEAQQDMALAKARHQQLLAVLSTAQRCNQHIQQLQQQQQQEEGEGSGQVQTPPAAAAAAGEGGLGCAACTPCSLPMQSLLAVAEPVAQSTSSSSSSGGCGSSSNYACSIPTSRQELLAAACGNGLSSSSNGDGGGGGCESSSSNGGGGGGGCESSSSSKAANTKHECGSCVVDGRHVEPTTCSACVVNLKP